MNKQTFIILMTSFFTVVQANQITSEKLAELFKKEVLAPTAKAIEKSYETDVERTRNHYYNNYNNDINIRRKLILKYLAKQNPEEFIAENATYLLDDNEKLENIYNKYTLYMGYNFFNQELTGDTLLNLLKKQDFTEKPEDIEKQAYGIAFSRFKKKYPDITEQEAWKALQTKNPEATHIFLERIKKPNQLQRRLNPYSYDSEQVQKAKDLADADINYYSSARYYIKDTLKQQPEILIPFTLATAMIVLGITFAPQKTN